MNTFWTENISILFQKDKLSHFFPISDMTLDEKLNSIVRLCAYISVVLYCKNKNYKMIYIFLTSLLFTFIIHKFSNQSEEEETNIENYVNEINKDLQETEESKDDPFLNKKTKVIKPSINNPFTNILFNEYEDNPNRKSAVNIERENINEEIEDKFNFNLYKDINDIYSRNNSQRQFYTTPITTIPNKQKEFAQWLYKLPKTCKENNGLQCIKNNYTPLNGSSRLPLI